MSAENAIRAMAAPSRDGLKYRVTGSYSAKYSRTYGTVLGAMADVRARWGSRRVWELRPDGSRKAIVLDRYLTKYGQELVARKVRNSTL